MEKGKVTISIVVFLISVVLISLLFIQFRTVEETNLIGIETMQEEELRQEIVNWKTKYNEIDGKVQANNEKIQEYENIIKNNQESSELIDKELKEYNMLVGKTNVIGDGIVIKLTDTTEASYTAVDLLYLVNELKYAEAEAISINNQRITNSTEIVLINGQHILINGERVSGPYEVKAIGNQNKMQEVLNFENDGYIEEHKSKGYNIEMSLQSNIRIEATKQEMTLKYIKGEE